MLHIGRQSRPKLYDFFDQRPDAPDSKTLAVRGPRANPAYGEVLHSLEEDQVREVARKIKASGVGVVAVCLLHSYVNPRHELRVREILLEEVPELKISLSSDILPEIKEYERMSTTVINAYVMPIVEGYLQRIVASLAQTGVNTRLNIMQSNGGIMTAETAGRKSVHTVLSGPAAGVLGGLALSKMVGLDNIITIDMGGTSFDVSLAHHGAPTYSTESDIDGHPIKIPMIDIKTLGAGGGSIARVDVGGALQVGPESAGADPGPACYGWGGEKPTVSDANLVLGYLNPQYFAGGDMGLNVDLAREAIRRHIADPMGLSVEAAAEGILRVVNATMIRGIRLVSVEKGFDPRDFTLVCFGGAGPVHGVRLAQELNMPKLLIPGGPGVTCALGLLMADFRHDYSQTFISPLTALDPFRLNAAYEAIESRARQQMIEEGFAVDAIQFTRAADMRYGGQGYEIEIGLPNERYDKTALRRFGDDFGRHHRASYGYEMSADTVEIITLRLTAIGFRLKPEFLQEPATSEDPARAYKSHRRVFMDGAFLEIPIYERGKLKSGMRVRAPAIVEQVNSTTVLFPGYELTVDVYRNLLIERQGHHHG